MPITRRGNERAIARFEARNAQLKAKREAKEKKEAARVARVKAVTDPKSVSGKKVTKEQAKKIKKQGKNQRFKTPKGGYQRVQTGRLGRNVHWSE